MKDKVISMKKKSIDLINELSISKEAEQHRYIIKFEYKDNHTDFYSLYDSIDNKLVMIDKMFRIKSWLKIRNITTYFEAT